MILMTQYHPRSRVIRRCDARCFAAIHGKCNCICGGRNHGVGLEKALINVEYLQTTNALKGTNIQITRRALRELRRREEAHANHA